MRDIFFHQDNKRGSEATLLWLVEEVGELAKAIRKKDPENMSEELADILAWLASLANILDIDLEEVALKKYGQGCPRCKENPCTCQP
jgi:NTP pyrophosphatase (non-canonical NTP hydrolase)